MLTNDLPTHIQEMEGTQEWKLYLAQLECIKYMGQFSTEEFNSPVETIYYDGIKFNRPIFSNVLMDRKFFNKYGLEYKFQDDFLVKVWGWIHPYNHEYGTIVHSMLIETKRVDEICVSKLLEHYNSIPPVIKIKIPPTEKRLSGKEEERSYFLKSS